MTIEHRIVCAGDGVYAGWPANHGGWQWGDEFLIGFLVGEYFEYGSVHNVRRPFTKLLARSRNGGDDWSVIIPNVDFNAEVTTEAPPFELTNGAIIRACGQYDHGGETSFHDGGFYLSQDRGVSWLGAFAFTGIDEYFANPNQCTSRTAVLDNLVFLSRADRRMWGTDMIFCAAHDGERFNFKSKVVDDDCRAVMPAVARLGSRIVLVARRLGRRRSGGWIDAYASDDEGRSWQFLSHVADTGLNNGNPPALIESGGRLFCAYGNRDSCGIYLSVSDDGVRWYHHRTVREGDEVDVGYPRLFKREDGKLCCVYYWSSPEHREQHIAATILEV